MNRVVCFFFSWLIVCSAVSAAQTVSPAGHWEGSIAVPTGDLKVMVDLDRDAKGTWIGDIDIPEQGVKDLPLPTKIVRPSAPWTAPIRGPWASR